MGAGNARGEDESVPRTDNVEVVPPGCIRSSILRRYSDSFVLRVRLQSNASSFEINFARFWRRNEDGDSVSICRPLNGRGGVNGRVKISTGRTLIGKEGRGGYFAAATKSAKK